MKTKKIIVLFIVGMFSMSIAAIPVAAADASVVTIPDPKMEMCLRAYAGIPAPLPIADVALEAITGTVTCSEMGVTDLTGAEYLVNIDYFYADYNLITSLEPLRNLTQLTHLSVGGNQIESVEPIKNLTNLISLELYNNDIFYIDDLAAMTELTYLEMTQNMLQSIEPLASMTKLENLWLEHNQLKDISVITNFTQLKQLDVVTNHIADFSPLAGLENLTTLLVDNQVITLNYVENTGTVAITDPLINVDGTFIAPETISNDGTYTDGIITWANLDSSVTETSFTFDTTIYVGSISAPLSGKVFQELD